MLCPAEEITTATGELRIRSLEQGVLETILRADISGTLRISHAWSHSTPQQPHEATPVITHRLLPGG